MTLQLLTADTVPAHQLAGYAALDRQGEPGVRAGWLVTSGPITQVLLLQDAVAPLLPPPPIVPSGFDLERREQHWLRAVRPHRRAEDDIAVMEMRTYDVRVGQGEAFVALMLDALPLRQRYSKNYGVWTSLSGRMEQVRHLWGYRSLAQRDSVRAQLKDDAAWGRYTARILPMLEVLHSMMLAPLATC